MEKIRLLIVEEVSRIREIIRYALENSFSEIEIHEADNAEDAKVKLENMRYDLILCDWDAPNIKGDQLLKWMKGNPALNAVPFIMLTSKSERSYLATALQLGVNSYLIKPFSHAGLVHRIMSVVSGLDRRELERFASDSPVFLTFHKHKLDGNLIEISMSGLLGIFRRKEFFPQIMERVTVDLEPDGRQRISGIHGFVIRIQSAEGTLDSQYVNIAVKFLDITPETRNELIDFFGTLIMKT